jgi:hypothetical protein
VLVRGESTRIGFVVRKGDGFSFGGGLGRSPRSPHTPTWTASVPSAIAVSDSGGSLRALNHVGAVTLTVQLPIGTDTASLVIADDSSATRARAVRVGVGSAASCLEQTGGRIYCWGSSWRGEIGNGSARPLAPTLSPARVQHSGPLHGLSVGSSHACAIGADERAVCWGDNAFGAIIPRGQDIYPLPILVSDRRDVVQVAAGGDHTCVLSRRGRLTCWGRPFPGVQDLSIVGTIRSVYTGHAHTCVLDIDGRAWCRGSGSAGELGNGSFVSSPAFVAVATEERFTSLALGGLLSCGVTTTARALCWGDGRSGQFGDGSFRASALPVLAHVDEAVVSIATGSDTVCVVSSTGGTFCWGHGEAGQLGIGPLDRLSPPLDHQRTALPLRVRSSHRFTSTSVNLENACGILADSTVMCWGHNRNGQVGIGRFAMGADGLMVSWEPEFVRLGSP